MADHPQSPMPQALGTRVEDWSTAALILGESLAANGPDDYYLFTPQQWLTWALSALSDERQAALLAADAREKAIKDDCRLIHDAILGRAEQAEASSAALRERLKEVISLFDDPCPYDSATTLAVARQALLSPVLPVQTISGTRSCNEPTPDRSGRVCDKPKGHDGPHWTYGGSTLTWPQAVLPVQTAKKTEDNDLARMDEQAGATGVATASTNEKA